MTVETIITATVKTWVQAIPWPPLIGMPRYGTAECKRGYRKIKEKT